MKCKLLLASSGVLALVAAAQPAWAQTDASDTTPTTEECAADPSLTGCVNADGSDPAERGAIVVTGSRIARPTLESNVPVTSIDSADLLAEGDINIGDALNDLPSLRSTFSTANSTRFIGTTGLNLLDLRGLGTERTLVLVNGKRHVTSSAGDFSVDVNTIPAELLERVDVVTGGNSAVYGSDAIAGVVNFILKRDFDGLVLRGQGGVSSRNDRGAYFVSGTFGKNFADGRGNIAIAGEYSKANEVRNVDRPGQSGAFTGFKGFTQTDDTIGEPREGDGIPDNTFEFNQRLAFISDGGTFSPLCIDPSVQIIGCTASGLDQLFRFNRSGRLVAAAAPIRELRDIDGATQLGGDGSTLSNTGQIYPDIERYSINLLARYDVSDAFRPYFEAKYTRLNAILESSPSFFNGPCQGTVGSFGGIASGCSLVNTANAFITYDNAFLNPADSAFIRAAQNEFLSVFGAPPISNGFFLNRNNVDFGARGEFLKRETYRFVAGFEGTFNDDWKYDVSATYGKFEGQLRSTNNLVTQRFRNAVDAVRTPGGQVVCRINADVSTANDDAACVPINLFGEGAPSQAALNYVNTTSVNTEDASQLDITAYVSGDLSQLFELPGGPIGFVVGGEYRRERSGASYDELTRSGGTFLNAIPNFDPPTFSVAEVFGELRVPVLANMEFAELLEFSAAGRISDYNSGAGDTGTTYTYNVGAIYAPISDIKARVNYSRAVRSPTPGALFTAQTQNFAFLTDPCDQRFINNGTATRIANCRADGVPVGYQQAAGNRPILQGGNPGLEAEKSNSLTVGAIVQPRFAPGLSFTVDYYQIDVDNLIATVSGNAILQNCYDAPDLNNQFCDLVFPRQANGAFNATAAVLVSTTNFAKLEADGIDFDLAYRRTFDNGDRLRLGAIATHVIKRTNFLDVNNPDIPNRVKSELGDPAWAANFNASYKRGAVTFGYGLRYVGKQTINIYEATNEFNGNPPSNPDGFPQENYPEVFYHDVRFDVEVNNKFTFYVGVDNVSDRLPPLGLTGLGAGSGIYDNIGRFFYAGARANF